MSHHLSKLPSIFQYYKCREEKRSPTSNSRRLLGRGVIHEDYYSNLDSNTVVIFFGDARNNKNETSEDKFKKISEKVRSVIWLNPESKDDWNTGDSIIKLYSKYINNLYKVETTTDLIHFLEDIEV